MSAGEWPKIAVVGAGAVGGYFGGMLARAGAPVIFIGRQTFVDAVKQNGLLLDTVQFLERVKIEASADLAAARDAKVILFCVKTTDTADTARRLADVLSKDAIIEDSWASGSVSGTVAFWLGVLVALMTSFYSWRLVFLTFFGEPRWAASEHIQHALHGDPPRSRPAHPGPGGMLGMMWPIAPVRVAVATDLATDRRR